MRSDEPFNVRLMRLLRSGLAGLAATGADIATLSLFVAVFHWNPRAASIPALFVGGFANFVGNRGYAFHARAGDPAKQALGYTVVEGVALALNGLLYEVVLRTWPDASRVFWLVRICTTNLVFVAWSYPLWKRVFRVPPAP